MHSTNELQDDRQPNVRTHNGCQQRWDEVENFKAADAVALAELITPLASKMDRRAQSITRNFADTEDVRQNAILKAYSRRLQLRSAEKFVPWIMRITVTEALLHRRNQRSHLFTSLDDHQHSRLPVNPGAQLDCLEREETRRSVLQALSLITTDHREILVLHYWKALSVSRIADRLRLSTAAVKTRLFRARQRLRVAIEKQNAGGTTVSPPAADLHPSQDLTA
jgi:RNA polymerase sigma-70 factor (ECF subfamily)